MGQLVEYEIHFHDKAVFLSNSEKLCLKEFCWHISLWRNRHKILLHPVCPHDEVSNKLNAANGLELTNMASVQDDEC